jgi:gas vesicle protein
MNGQVLVRHCLLFLFLIVASPPLLSASTDSVVSKELFRIAQAKASQKRVDKLYERTEKLINSYQSEKKVVEGLAFYNNRLDKTVFAQKQRLAELVQSLEEASKIERQLLPLMLKMLYSIDQFIELDIPFQKEKRIGFQENIKSYMSNNKIAISERFRLVLESYTREIGYGETIGYYNDTVSFEGRNLEVELLRIGRVGLYFQTKDGLVSGVWNKASSNWKKLSSRQGRAVSRGIRISQGKESPDLLKELPLIVNRSD